MFPVIPEIISLFFSATCIVSNIPHWSFLTRVNFNQGLDIRLMNERTKEDADGKKITGWQREEREMSREEYDRLTLMQEVVASNTTEIVESVTQFQKDAVIDEYTQQLIEEGLI